PERPARARAGRPWPPSRARPARRRTGPRAPRPKRALPAAPARRRLAAARLGLVDLEGPAGELAPVQLRDGLVRLLGVGHLDESEPARTAGLPVGHHLGLDDAAQLTKEVA